MDSLYVKQGRGFSFRPSVLPALATLLLLPLLFSLGIWQLDRAEQKRELGRQFALGSETIVAMPDALDIQSSGDAHGGLARYQRVQVRGRFEPAKQFLLDNMLYKGVAGFEVLSILEVEGMAQKLLVNRGWKAFNNSREFMAPLPPDGELSLTGRLDRLPRPGIELGGAPPAADAVWPRLVLYPTMAELAAQSGFDLYPWVLLAESNAGEPLIRDWRPVNSDPRRHLAYAVQWFALAGTLLIIFVVVNLKRRNQ